MNQEQPLIKLLNESVPSTSSRDSAPGVGRGHADPDSVLALPGELFSWDVTSPNVDRAGPGGVSDDSQRAVKALAEALSAETPGARGEVWSVRLGGASGGVYVTEGLVATAHCDRQAGVVVERRS